jgi:hypothetical protein
MLLLFFTDKCLTETFIPTSVLPHDRRIKGKVRDVYVSDRRVVMIATDRQSAFDRPLASVPFKVLVAPLPPFFAVSLRHPFLALA